MNQNEQYYFELLTDVQGLVHSYAQEDSDLKKQLENLLNRQSPDGDQPFKITN